jgi:anti-sigma B factor antagonist
MNGDHEDGPVEEFAVSVADVAPGCVLVRVHGELDLETAGRLWAHLEPLLARDAVVVLDTEHMPFMDSSGLRVLLQAARRAAEVGATFRLAGLRSSVRRVLELTGVGGQLTVCEDVSDAMMG